MKYGIIAIFSLFTLMSCGDKAKSSAESGEKAVKTNVDRPTSGLYVNYVDNPTTVAEKDQNAIIEYASSKGLKCDVMANGVYVCDQKMGSGAQIQPRGPVRAHYKGYFFNGKEFDSSYKRNKPLEFKVGQMISGWNEWLVTVKEGTKATLLIPSAKAYGSADRGTIPPNTPLAFDVEVLNPTK